MTIYVIRNISHADYKKLILHFRNLGWHSVFCNEDNGIIKLSGYTKNGSYVFKNMTQEEISYILL